jgi:hypothetical protein
MMRNNQNSNNRTELMVMITPHIISHSKVTPVATSEPTPVSTLSNPEGGQ